MGEEASIEDLKAQKAALEAKITSIEAAGSEKESVSTKPLMAATEKAELVAKIKSLESLRERRAHNGIADPKSDYEARKLVADLEDQVQSLESRVAPVAMAAQPAAAADRESDDISA